MPLLGRELITCVCLSILPPLERHADGEAAVSIRGTPAAAWDRNTWPVLEDLARNHPESGIHFQSKTASLGGEEVTW